MQCWRPDGRNLSDTVELGRTQRLRLMMLSLHATCSGTTNQCSSGNDYRVSTLCYNWTMSAHASQAFSTSTVPVQKIYPARYAGAVTSHGQACLYRSLLELRHSALTAPTCPFLLSRRSSGQRCSSRHNGTSASILFVPGLKLELGSRKVFT